LQVATSWQWLRNQVGDFVARVLAGLIVTAIVFVAQRIWKWVTER
jgi:hypothetical protein